MSNKYYQNWSNHSEQKDSKSSGKNVLNHLEADNRRLDRILDRMDVEDKAKRIFAQNKKNYVAVDVVGPTMVIQQQQIIPTISYPYLVPVPVPVPVPVYPYQVQRVIVNNKPNPSYMLINGQLVPVDIL